MLAICVSAMGKTGGRTAPTNQKSSLPVQANGYNISVRAAQLANKTVFLGSYLNGKIFSVDTLRLNAEGKGLFSKKKKLAEGLYMLYVNEHSRYYEFLVGDEQNIGIALSDTTKGIVECFTATGAKQTVEFVNFGRFMTEKRYRQNELFRQIKNAKDDKEKKQAEDAMSSLNKEVEAKQAELAEKYKGKMLGVFINALIPPKFPKELIDGDSKDENFQMARYQYAKDHYFDNFDLSDPRVWRINMLNEKLNTFLNRQIIQLPDSIAPEGIKLIEKSMGDSTAFNLMTNYVITYSVESKIMGMDKLFAGITERYFLTGKAFWADSTLMTNIVNEYNKVRFNQIGMKGHNLPLVRLDGKKFNIYDLKKKFTLVYFYEPTCGHCQMTTPKIHDVYEKYKDKGFEVVAIYLMTDKKEWTDFIEKNKLQDWTNAWDPDRESYYWTFYDTSTTPGVYLLDKDKKIIAKKIDAESLDRILNYEINERKDNDKPRQAHAKVAEYEAPIDVQVQ